MAIPKVLVEVMSPDLVRDEFVSRSGKTITKFLQEAALHNGGRYPHTFNLTLATFFGDNEEINPPKPYEVGHYVLQPKAVKLNRFGALEIDDRIRLQKVQIPAQSAAKAA